MVSMYRLHQLEQGLLRGLRIDQLMDSTSKHETLRFMDAFSWYNQIWMVLEDEEKMEFITN